VCSSTPPSGYVTNNSDCNDADKNINPNTQWVMDADGDGYYVGNIITQCASPGPGYVVLLNSNELPGDCNDQDKTVHATFSFYIDHDGDGYGAGSLIQGICAVNATTPPAGYSTNNTDCNDNDASVWALTIEYIDRDHDGYDAGFIVVCAGIIDPRLLQLGGYSLTTQGHDCDDNNPLIHNTAIAGSISGAASVCSGTNSTTLTLNGYVGTNIQWQSSLNNTAFSNITGANNSTYIATNLSTKTYYRAIVSDGSCASATTTSVAITMGTLQNGTNLGTTNITSTTATLNWTSSFNPAQWQIEYKSVTPGSKWIDPPVQNGTARSFTLTGLNCNQGYQWHLRDNCGKIWISYSNAITFKTLACTSAAEMNQSVNVPETIQELQVRAMPNPTNTNFNIIVKGIHEGGVIRMVVVDMYGRMIESRELPNEQTITIGDNYMPGVYIVKFIQEDQSKQIKLIKLPQ
jgi:hypothetical protein